MFMTAASTSAVGSSIGVGFASATVLTAMSNAAGTKGCAPKRSGGRSHRRIISDYLMAADEIVFHIMDADRVERAEMTEGAKREPDGILTYPALL